ncbi:MAG TPA: LytR C-terminal domain-containing protein, partial [Thermoleophilaceae bacterium]|nr:LytR C-terminal domain-containing protein [Thermoleophilaceae bacterium]
VLGGGAAFAVAQITGEESSPAGKGSPDEGSAPASDPGDGDGGGARAKRAGVKPGRVTVAVLNGTTVPGLAASIADKVKSLGFQIGTVANGPDQESQRAESVVLYSRGKKPEAKAVSRRLGISQREPVDPESQGLAGDAGVVVIAGGDRAGQ